MKYCHNCGTENNDSNLFCISCGTKLIDIANLSSDFVVKNVENAASTDSIDSKDLDESKEISVVSDTSSEVIACSSKNELSIPNVQDNIPCIDKEININVKDNHFNVRKVDEKTIILTVFVAIFVLVSLLLGPKTIHYFNGQKALKSGDYETAISEYLKADGLLNSDKRIDDATYLLGEEYYLNEDYDNAYRCLHSVRFYGNAQDYLCDIADYFKANGDFRNAAFAYGDIESDYGRFQNLVCLGAAETDKESGKSNIFQRDYSNAKKYYEKAKQFDSDLAELFYYGVDYGHAVNLFYSGALNTSLQLLETLPEWFDDRYEKRLQEKGLERDTPSSKDLIKIIKSTNLIDACGTWKATKNYFETRSSWDYLGDEWVSSEYLFDDQWIAFLIVPNDDYKTFSIHGTVTYRYYEDYYSYYFNRNTPPKLITKEFVVENVTSIPSTITIDEYTKLKYNSNSFKLEYKYKKSVDTMGREIYTSNVTFGTRDGII